MSKDYRQPNLSQYVRFICDKHNLNYDYVKAQLTTAYPELRDKTTCANCGANMEIKIHRAKTSHRYRGNQGRKITLKVKHETDIHSIQIRAGRPADPTRKSAGMDSGTGVTTLDFDAATFEIGNNIVLYNSGSDISLYSANGNTIFVSSNFL